MKNQEIEYIKYEVDIMSEEKEFDTIDEANSYVVKLQHDIIAGYYDSMINDDPILFSLHPDDMELNRKQLCEHILLFKNYYTPSGIRKLKMKLNLLYDEFFDYEKITIDVDNKEYEVILNWKDDVVHVPGGMICNVNPWSEFGIPLQLSICICPDGGILHRGWSWNNNGNHFLHTSDMPNEVNVTDEMRNTIGGLFSGRINFMGLKLNVGRTVQKICPINIEQEEKIAGEKLYLA